MELTCIEWNINGRGGAQGRDFPLFISNVIDKADIIILVEFFKRKGWEKFYNKLSANYVLFLSEDYGEGKNQILIAIKKDLNPIIENVTSVIPSGKKLLEIPGLEYLHPEFLQIDAIINKDNETKSVSIIGTRIKTEKENAAVYAINSTRSIKPGRYSQLHLLSHHITQLSTPAVLCLGDFNVYGYVLKHTLDQHSTTSGSSLFKIFSADYKENQQHSYVQKDNTCCVLDHAICKGFKVKTPQQKCVWNIWNFVNRENGYGERKSTDYISDLTGLPDHACCKYILSL